MNLVQTSVFLGILCFTVQLIVNVKTDRRLIKWLPATILFAASVYNLVYWISGIGTYEYNDIISAKEADALCQAVILGAGIAGCAASGIISWLLKKGITKKRIFRCIALAVCGIVSLLLVPVPHRLKDGGSVEYKAVLYTVKSVHQINPDVELENRYIEGTVIKILGVEVFNNTDEKTNPKNNSKGGSSNTETATLKEAPALTVVCGKESVEALRGTSSWQYVNADGTSTAIESDSMHRLQAKEYMTPLKLIPTQYSSVEPLKAYLQWDVTPDKVSMRCWSEDCWEQVGEYEDTSEEITVYALEVDYAGGSYDADYSAKLKKDNCIYEVTAEWNSHDEFSGKAHYSFYTSSFYDIDVDDLKPVSLSE